MDPLSFTASIAAVLSLANSVGGVLKTMHSLRHAPDELLALVNEIADFEAVLRTVIDVCDPDSWECEERFKSHIERASTKLAALQAIVGPKKERNSRSVLERFKWLKARNQILIIRKELKVVNLNLLTTLGAVTHSSVRQAPLVLEEVRQGQGRLTGSPRHEPQELSSSCIQELAPLNANITSYKDEATSTCHSTLVCNDTIEKASDVWQVRTSLKATSNCKVWCNCACHKRHSFRTSQVFAGLLGSLFIGYVGGLVEETKCDESECAGHLRSSTSITYYFPSWFLVAMVTFAGGGPRMSMSTARVVPNDSPIFSYAHQGNIDRMKGLFEQRLASPFDVSPTGFSVLHVSSHIERSPFPNH